MNLSLIRRPVPRLLLLCALLVSMFAVDPRPAQGASGDAIADRVLGQPDFTSHLLNRGGVATAATLADPSGLALDGVGNLYVADFGNSRVLMYTPPFSIGIAATRVFGQPNFTSSTKNNGGPSAQ